MPLSRTASWILLAIAAAAPWFCGALSRLPGILWLFGGFQVLAFFLVLAERRKQRRGLQVSPIALRVCALLGLCLAWWATREEPPFATAFAAEHWRFMEMRFPTALLQWPRAERLWFLGSLLCGLLVAADLGRNESFRRHLCLVVGVSGVGIALGALAQRFLGANYLPWLEIVGSTERYNFSFFHHSGAAACLDFAWPLLAFREWGKERAWVARGVLWASLALLAVLCFPLWRSESAWAIAAGLALAGGAWCGLVRLKRVSPRWILKACGMALLAAFAWQIIAVQKMRAQFPDNWMNADVTRATASERDAVLRTRAAQRGDHLALSLAPPRPAAWLTGMRMAAAHPIIGDGPGSWVRNAVLYSNDPIVNTFYQHRQFAHHDLLQTAAEWGVVPALAWMVLWAGGFYRAIRRDPAGASEIALVLALFGLALHSLIHFPLQIPALQLWAALLLGLAWSRRPRQSIAANESHAAGRSRRSTDEAHGDDSPRASRSRSVRSRRPPASRD